MTRTEVIRSYETRSLDSEIRYMVIRRAIANGSDLDELVRRCDVSLSYGSGRYTARVRRPDETFDVAGHGTSLDVAIRAAMEALAVQVETEGRRARKMAAELLKGWTYGQ